MEKKIKRIVKLLTAGFILFWLSSLLIVILGETDILPVGYYADDVQMAYTLDSLAIIITAACIPMALKLFNIILKKMVDKMGFLKALQSYILLSMVRLALLFIPVMFGFMVYYMTLNKSGMFCALIGLTASLFCVPSEERLRGELYITKEEE